MRKGHLTLVTAISLLAIVIVTCTASNQITNTAALAQTIAADAATTTFDMNGAISSLVLGMPPNTKTVDMTTVQKFILSGDWSMDVNQEKLTNFKGNFYTGPVNG
jgi:hypothetical protein